MTTATGPPPTRPRSRRGSTTVAASRSRRIGGHVLTYAAAAVVGLFAVIPFVWMLVTSIKPRNEILSRTPVFWPSEPQWGRYADVVERGFGQYLFNSVTISLSATLLGVGFSALAGYALARMHLPLKRYLALTVLATQMFPVVVLIIPLFSVMRNAGLLDTYVGLIVSYLALTTPLAIWILRGFFQNIPDDLENAALVDGCTRWGAIWRVVLPMAGPGIAASSIFVFNAAWDEFIFALTFTSTDAMRTLPVALQSYVGLASTDYGGIMSSSVLFTMPVVVFFLFVHRKVVTGMTAGALKG